jgi:3-oxoacyl-ACP reductase-like protein
MDLIRIRVTKLDTAAKVAQGMGLIIDQVCGDQDKAYVNIGARRAGPWGNHEPRWTDEQRAEFLNWRL